MKKTLLTAAAALPAAWLGWTLFSRLRVPHDLPLPPAVEAERRTLEGRAGRLNMYVAGSGAPLLLIHGVNAAASAYEVRPLFEHYRATRRVYALDLPGFGFSERSDREYTPRLMTDAIHAALDEIARESGEPVDALALSLGGEFLARAAAERPDRFRSVALVTPTGFGKTEQFYGPLGSTRGRPGLKRAYEHPLLGQAFYDALASAPSLRFFLKQTFGSYAAVDEGLLRYDYPTSHVPGARHAPFSFISGLLFSADIDRVYEVLSMPVWLAYGTNDRFTDFGDLTNVERRSNWSFSRFDTGALVYFEQPERFFAAYDTFLAGRG
ncbi:pimeloyl-ACP methyl ester carboxylesterase [Deinococcus sp. HSC-46F16]|uniref:alpha/beta fold hydrolase n=1 Tax=Deinococcus sp. HSC-46F16 TaxID=2910968 RepID=UPI00209EEC27|nr:alpha/beta fold hydrolase [Deinococcus sp. HSC-46F16]MCP2015133.1 pimeloyl-ACP methyl ester carboxylesterase [Deinococcus sp. HSC-46F16]